LHHEVSNLLLPLKEKIILILEQVILIGEADHSLPTSAEVKKMWLYIPTLPCAFMA
jgi:hypothetical protein